MTLEELDKLVNENIPIEECISGIISVDDLASYDAKYIHAVKSYEIRKILLCDNKKIEKIVIRYIPSKKYSL